MLRHTLLRAKRLPPNAGPTRTSWSRWKLVVAQRALTHGQALQPIPALQGTTQAVSVVNFPQRTVDVAFRVTKREGCKGFDRAFESACDTVLNHPPGLHHSRSLVLKCSAGVGKTFLTITLRAKNQAPNREVVSAYIGFNVWPMSIAETKLLQSIDASTINFKMRWFLYRRLLASLKGLRDRCVASQPPSLSNLDTPDSDVQFALVDPETTDVRAPDDPALESEAKRLSSEIVSVVAELGSLVAAGCTLMVAVVVDDGQHLNGFPLNLPDAALCCLRQLQCAVLKATMNKVLIMPIMTGTPVTTVRNKKTGQNILLSREEVMMSREEFVDLATALFPKVEHIRRVAKFLYPRILQLMKFCMGRPVDCSPNNGLMDTSKLFTAAFQGTTLRETEVDMDAIAVVRRGKRVMPILDATVWRDLASQHATTHRSTPEAAACPFVTPATCQKTGNNCYSFEDHAFDVIGFWLATFGPIPHPSNLHRVVRQWLPLQRFRLMRCAMLAEPARHCHPFDPCSSHVDAYYGNLSPEFADVVVDILAYLVVSSDGACAMWVRCGGTAPVDFILLVCWRDESDRLVGTVRFMDAKHTCCSKQQTKDAVATLEADLSTVTNKAQMLHAGLTRELAKQFRLTLDAFDPSHVTAATNIKGSTGRVFSPDTFQWHPWTLTLYDTVNNNNTVDVP